VTALAKRFGVARSTIQRRLAKGWVPPAKVERKVPRRATPRAAPGAAPVVAATAAPSQRWEGVTAAALVAALALATCSAAFSISGLTAIFAGAFWSVIGLGVAFELGKLSAVARLGRHGPGALRVALGASETLHYRSINPVYTSHKV
jgi:hypothetical protein